VVRQGQLDQHAVHVRVIVQRRHRRHHLQRGATQPHQGQRPPTQKKQAKSIFILKIGASASDLNSASMLAQIEFCNATSASEASAGNRTWSVKMPHARAALAFKDTYLSPRTRTYKTHKSARTRERARFTPRERRAVNLFKRARSR
jgi:hypothetical protein